MEQEKISRILAEGKFGFSIEILPPKSSAEAIDRFLEDIKEMDLVESVIHDGRKLSYKNPKTLPKPRFVSITYHQPKISYEIVDGERIKLVERGRPGTQGLAGRIIGEYVVLPHLICGGFTKDETEIELIDFHYMGIKNILALQGDPEKGKKGFTPVKGGNRYASDLVMQIQDANRGVWIASDYKGKTDFDVGVACYPQKHYASSSLEVDVENLKRKQDAGADYAIMQMEFDVETICRFRDYVRTRGIIIPLVPGIKILENHNQARRIQESFRIAIPEQLFLVLEESENPQKTGIEHAVGIIGRLKSEGFPHVHIYTRNKSSILKELLFEVYSQ